jgi:hypothetical protein
VMHLDVTPAMAERAADTFRRVVPKLTPVG